MGTAITEEFLHFVWQHRLAGVHFVATTGEDITILEPGLLNCESGPDFLECRIRIGNILLVGNVEVDLTPQQWRHHQHHLNPEFNSVILHVVWEAKGTAPHCLPVIQLKGKVPENLIRRANSLLTSTHDPPCAPFVDDVPVEKWRWWLGRLAVERLESRFAKTEKQARTSEFFWHEVLYATLLRYMGVPSNTYCFEQLAEHIPYRLLSLYSERPLYIEALLYGCGGLLDQLPPSPYTTALKETFRFLQHKHSLSPIALRWAKGRYRPQASPFVRIAQMASLLQKIPALWRDALTRAPINTLREHLSVQPSPEWIEQVGTKLLGNLRSWKIGTQMQEILIINAIAPVAFAYGKLTGNQHLCDHTLHWLSTLPPENNRYTRLWAQTGVRASSALESQALIQLYAHYCAQKRCLQCNIGTHLLAPPSPPP